MPKGIGDQGLLRFLEIRCFPKKRQDGKNMCKRKKVGFFVGILNLKKRCCLLDSYIICLFKKVTRQ